PAVADVNDAPVAGSTSYTVNEDGQITISSEQLLANSSDVDGTVSLDSVSYSGTDGVLITNDDGSVTFSPNENFNGDISLDVVVIDDDGATAETTAGITTLAVNDVPVVDGNVAYSVDEDGSITLSQEQLLANASDIDGDNLSAENLSVGDNATVVANPDGSFTITPDADFNGDLDLSFDVSDGTTTVATGVDLTVNPINDAAVAPDVAFEMNEDGVIIITDEQLLAGASDIDGDDLSIDTVTYTGTDGVLTDNGDGTHSFAPNENFNGDVALEFGVSDGTVVTPANIDIAVADVNDAPVAGSTSYTVNEDGQITISAEQLLANSSDVDGTVSLDSVSYSGTDGILIQNQDGSVTFSPNENFNGDISLDVVVIDDDGATAETTAGITTLAVNDAPVVDGNVAYTMDEDGVITVTQEQLLANASDIDGDELTASNLAVNGNGSVVDNGNGTFSITPDPDYNGDLGLTFDVSDGEATVSAAMDLTVNPINDLPTAPTINLEGTEDVSITINPEYILSQASDIDGDNLTLDNLSVRQPANSSLTQNQDGTYNLITPEHFNGLIELSYTISDETGEEVEGELAMDIIPVDDSPFQNGNAHLTIQEDGDITFSEADLLALFGDVDSSLTISKVVTADGEEADGSITDNGDGTWTFSPTDDFAGTAGLQIVATDGNTEATVDLPIYIRPVADGTVITTAHEGPLVFAEDSMGHFSLNVEMLDASETMESLVMTGYPVGFVVSDGTNTITITEEGQVVDITQWNLDDLSMTPPEDYNGNFFVTVSSVTLDVGDESSVEDDSPLLTDVPQEEAFAMNDDGYVLLEASDLLESQGLDPEAVNVESVSYSGEEGVLIDNDNETWTFWSDPDYQGPVTVDFTVDDGSSHTVDFEISAINTEASADNIAEASIEAPAATIVTVEELLENVEGIEGDNLTISNVQAENAVVTDLLDGSYSVEQDTDLESALDLTYSVSNGTDTVDSSITLGSAAGNESENYDYTAAPGGSVNVSIPTDISSNSEVDHVIISGLPEGVSPQSGIEQGDSEYLIAGDLCQPVKLEIPESFTGDINMDMSGVNSMDQPIDGASTSISIDVDASYEMDGSSADTQQLTTGSDDSNAGDWTSGDNTDLGIDVMDDSASFDDSAHTTTEDDTTTLVDSI
ncbi:tandem-95 repeat protein, partial [Shewanella sp. UCD-KL21]|uniref:tandem-95 repeat protein n=1 Tax=Shewanella sp. UCD-KL21 TaxID=1917164 RepID=UPI0009706298